MAEAETPKKQPKSKKILINVIILIVALMIMLAASEGVMRWIDGFQLSTLELNQDTTPAQTE